VATNAQLWAMIAGERVGLADIFDGLSASQWQTPSLCEGWTVRDVAAHLVTPLSQSLPRLVLTLASYRFDFDRYSFTEARKNTMTGARLAAVLRAKKDHRFAPPGFGPIAPLTDVVVHGQDVCIPLGIEREVAPDRALPILDFLVSAKATRGFVQRGRLDGVTWVCPDLEWSFGEGAVVEGPARSVILMMLGRHELAGLTGDGLELLHGR
jgi:uncharacterized protein (TIGR03083 family)